MRCNDCNKFVSFDEQEPEVDSIDVDDEGNVSATVRIVNGCAECGSELTEYTFDDLSADHSDEVKAHREDNATEEHELSVEDNGAERTNPDLQPKTYKKCPACKGHGDGTCPDCNGEGKVVKPIPSRFRKTYYGFHLDYSVTCSCGDLTINDEFEDATQASSMDELQ